MTNRLLACAVQVLRDGGIVCHACEGVWGFACDPWNRDAVQRILKIKQRPSMKGFILIGHDQRDFETELNQLDSCLVKQIVSHWPGHTTWVVPNSRFPAWVTGSFDTVAIRVPAHEQTRALISNFGGPLISTSANLSGKSPPTTEDDARIKFSGVVDYVLSGMIVGSIGPSTIRDALSGDTMR